MSDADYAAAGTAVTGLADDGKEWVSTYAIPAAIVLLGIGFVWKLTNRGGKRLASSV